MSEISRLTESARDWNKDGQDDAHIIYNTTEEVVEHICDYFGIEMTDAQASRVEMALHDPVRDSIDWDVLEQDNESARDWEDAKRSAIEHY